jgi:hypothetical protein
VGNVVLAVLAQVAAVRVVDGGGVVEHAGHLLLVDRDDDRHLVLGGDLRDGLGRGAGHRLGGVVPALVLPGAEVGAVEDLLQAEDLDALPAGLLDERDVLVEHRLLDLRHRLRFIIERIAALDQSADQLARHGVSPAPVPGRTARRDRLVVGPHGA